MDADVLWFNGVATTVKSLHSDRNGFLINYRSYYYRHYIVKYCTKNKGNSHDPIC